ncbi:MAG: hypothetical protein HQM12_09005 [SAR324 cluster bacterium]|nr:hypothetical protein [SAR324 cluster bacterium]MBF0350297.1 hypothetical protein [SAR324 cluster bacterium]
MNWTLNLLSYGGMVVLVLAFVMNQLNRWSTASLMYCVFNAFGAGCLLLYVIIKEEWALVPMELLWMLASIWGYFRNKRSV